MPNQQAAVRDYEGVLGAAPSVTTADAVVVAGSVVAGGIGATAGGWDTAAHRDTTIVTIGEMKTVINTLVTLANTTKQTINTLITELRAKGIVA